MNHLGGTPKQMHSCPFELLLLLQYKLYINTQDSFYIKKDIKETCNQKGKVTVLKSCDYMGWRD